MQLPPLKRKRDHEEIPQTTTESPPSNGQLAIDYNYDHSPTVVIFFNKKQKKSLIL